METNNLILFDYMTLLKGLSLETAIQVMESINTSPAMQHVEAHMRSTDNHKWDIVTECRLLRGLFLKDPEKFVVELNDGLVKQINKEQKNPTTN